MVVFSKIALLSFALLTQALPSHIRNINGGQGLKITETYKSAQNIVTWDKYSLKVNGERIFVFSGEYHPWRLPVQSLHLDVLQKIKAMGFQAVSIYTHWGLVEHKRGEIVWNDIFDLQPFFDAAKQAGIYVIARPGPYINAETTGGGFPGWGTRVEGLWRTSNSNYTAAWQPYSKSVNQIIAKNQITNGGPVILVQVENEYTNFGNGQKEDAEYERLLLESFRNAGIVVPLTTNDAWPAGIFKSVDIYGYDGYPLGFDCSHPQNWPKNGPERWQWDRHMSINGGSVLNAVFEFQGGAFDGWGGAGYDKCAALVGPEFARGCAILCEGFLTADSSIVYYKNQYALSTTLFNLYMIYGGTNWGGLAHPGVYTSYGYGAAINEDRTLSEKYYELKLQSNFLNVSPQFLTARPANLGKTGGAYTVNSVQALDVTLVKDDLSDGGFYIVRQTDASKLTGTDYKLSLTTSKGALTIPQLGGTLTLNGRDAKIHVADYNAGSARLIYSTGEIMTWKVVDGKTIIVLYGNQGELHETALSFSGDKYVNVLSGDASKVKNQITDYVTIQYTTSGQTVVQVGANIQLYILDRKTAYQFWVPNVAITAPQTQKSLVVKGGYLIRAASMNDRTVTLTGDVDGETTFEVLAPASVNTVIFNQKTLSTSRTNYGSLIATTRPAALPAVSLPQLSSLNWKYQNSLPEISSSYDDSKWTRAMNTYTPNPTKPKTPVVLYASDYGYHVGNIIWRGHFTAAGGETGFNATIQGGLGFGFSIWDNDKYVGYWEGNAVTSKRQRVYKFATAWAKGEKHVLTILQDHQGLEENWYAATEDFKAYRGIYDYSFTGASGTTLNEWRVTGNLGGESYQDKTRGPFNEGGLYAERQGWHLPSFDDSPWGSGNVLTGMQSAGVGFYRTSFNLNVPTGVDYPMAIQVSNSTTNPYYRAQLYVNGYQFGKYINSLGPQTKFFIPQGILNYNGANTLAVSLWAQQPQGNSLNSIDLVLTKKVEGGVSVSNSPMPKWVKRNTAY